MSYRGMGQATPPAPPAATPPAPPAAGGSPFANAVLIGGPVVGLVALVVGHAMGQHRLWTEHIFPGKKKGGH